MTDEGDLIKCNSWKQHADCLQWSIDNEEKIQWMHRDDVPKPKECNCTINSILSALNLLHVMHWVIEKKINKYDGHKEESVWRVDRINQSRAHRDAYFISTDLDSWMTDEFHFRKRLLTQPSRSCARPYDHGELDMGKRVDPHIIALVKIWITHKNRLYKIDSD